MKFRMLIAFLFCLVSNVYPISTAFDTIIDLTQYEKKVYSQNGEDGIIKKIFETVGAKSRYFVEFGVQNGQECNTRYLREKFGWTGLMMDCDFQNSVINLQKERITAENINDLFHKYHVPYEFDLLSIDIDSNDFYVWKAITDFSPRVVVIEYNSSHSPSEDKIIMYDPNQVWDGTNYYGASLLALYKLARSKGYSLIYSDNLAVNAFFVRDDVLKSCSQAFKDTNCVDKIYKGFARHVKDNLNRGFVSAEEILK